MPRDIDERKKRKALRKLRKAAELAEQGLGPPLSDWEAEFLREVEERIETYGSAFNDREKGALDEPLSALQTQKLKEINKKARGKGGGLKTRKPLGAKGAKPRGPRVRDINEDAPAEPEAPDGPRLVARGAPDEADAPPAETPKARPALRVIKGGADE
ncbi:MAG: hypothetical protein AAFX03_08735 [Pseudomonadota bacterium]